jgi:RNA polymerase sigma factor (sigma-70 family)
MQDDWELLAQYQRDRSQSAFAEIVARHLALVYGVCRRRLRDAALAEDVAQAVFWLLSRRPPRPAGHRGASIAAWLVKTAHYACNNAMRGKITRQHHERAAAEAKQAAAGADAGVTDQQVAVDAALAALPDRDRDILLMRYHEGLDTVEIGRRIGIAGNSAVKRISRALERVRAHLRGIGMLSVPAAAVVAARIGSIAEATIPTGLDQRIADAVVGGAAAAQSSIAITVAERTLAMWRIAQFKWIAASAAVVVIGLGGIAGIVTALWLNEGAANDGKAGNAAIAAAPATAPAAAADNRSPREVLQAFAKASRTGDVESMASLVHAEADAEKRLLDAACSYASASRRLRSEVGAKFGEPVAQKLAQEQVTPLERFAVIIETMVDTAPITIDGDFATFAPPDLDIDIILQRTDGGWKISATRMTETWSPQIREQRAAELSGAADMMLQLADEVRDGKFADAKGFQEAMKQLFGKR